MKQQYFEVLLEDIDSKLDTVIESLSFMASKAQVEALDQRFQGVESDVKIIKDVVTEHSLIFRQNGMRLQKAASWQIINGGANWSHDKRTEPDAPRGGPLYPLAGAFRITKNRKLPPTGSF